MPRARKNTTKNIETYTHPDKERVNNPPVGLVTPDTDKDAGKKTYAYDPHLDPQLQWAGKAEHTSFAVPTVSLHVHERIDPRSIIEAVRKQNSADSQLSLFATSQENPPIRQAIEFYKHKHNWTNRLIAGDSLLVMNSLLEKEGMAGKVQMVYIDPPYGIRYGSNFQPFVNKRDVADGRDEDLTQEPETIRAFRDTWELGIHSYLAYLRDRLLLARELLTESGSCFVQISDENLHHVRELMDEVFGVGNFVSIISVRKTTSQGTASLLGTTTDFIVWYARARASIKYHQIFVPRSNVADERYDQALLPDGSVVSSATLAESQENHARLFRLDNLASSRPAGEGDVRRFEFSGGTYTPGKGTFKTHRDGLTRLAHAERLHITSGSALSYRRFKDDFPVAAIGNLWHDISGAVQSRSDPKVYVVQSSTEIIARCLLMTTDPGDLVFDPTCGSGTTAFVAEQWGRRWITCDTSRVAVTLAKQRLMTANFDYYTLAHPNEGVGSGFQYKTVPHITLGSIANNPDIREGMTHDQINAAIARHAPQETLYDQPLRDTKKARVTGPFTVEAVPAPAVKAVDEVVEPFADPHPSPLPGGEGDKQGAVENPLPSGEGGRRPGEGKPPLNSNLLTLARKLRKEQTDAEQLLWQLLRDKQFCGLKFRRQHPVAPYILDFYCHEERLGIELDGGQHNEPDKKHADEERTVFLESKGIRLIRFWNNDVLRETEAVLERLYNALTPALSQREREKTLAPRERVARSGAKGRVRELGREVTADESVARSGETLRQGEWRDELLKTGIRGKAGQRISFVRLEPLPATRWLHAEGETRPDEAGTDVVSDGGTAWNPERVVVSFGPDHAPLEQRQVGLTIEEAQSLVPKPKIVVFAAFQFDPEASKDIDETNWPGITLLKVQMNADLLTDDLKKKRASNESFWLIGQPDVEVAKITEGDDRGKCRVSVLGFDYYNTKTGGIESGGADKIAMWLLDPDYDGRSLFPRQVFFPMADAKDGWAKLARNLKTEIDEDLLEAYRGTVSLPFAPGEHRRIAVKIIDDRGIESLKIVEIE